MLAVTSVSMDVVQQADKPDTHARLKALYIYQFTTMVDWPKEFKKGDFVVGVFGDDKVYDELQLKFSNKSVGSQSIKIKNFKSTGDIAQCQVLFVGSDKSDQVSSLAAKYRPQSTLIVSEKEGMLNDGAIINFVVRNNKQTYELSKKNASKHKLVIGSRLENLAFSVQ